MKRSCKVFAGSSDDQCTCCRSMLERTVKICRNQMNGYYGDPGVGYVWHEAVCYCRCQPQLPRCHRRGISIVVTCDTARDTKEGQHHPLGSKISLYGLKTVMRGKKPPYCSIIGVALGQDIVGSVRRLGI